MDWATVSIIIDLVGVVGVIATLGYLAVQIRENTRATLAASRQGLIDSELGLLSAYIDHAIDPHFITDDMALSPEDERRFTWIVVKALRIREFAWHQHASGSLDDASWQSYMAPVPGIFATERAKAILRFYVGSPGFMQVLHERLATAAPLGPLPQRPTTTKGDGGGEVPITTSPPSSG